MTSRQQVAKKLREMGQLIDLFEGDKAANALIALRDVTNEPEGYAPLFDCLANLIDPTSKYLPINCATWFDDNDVEHEDESLEDFDVTENAFCPFCGYEMMTGEEGWFDYEHKEHGNQLIPRFNYCPGCGSRVVCLDE